MSCGQQAGALVAANGRVQPRYPDGLTEREVEVLRLVARGMTDREIAYELGLAEKTVANHVGGVRKKTASSSRSQAVARTGAHSLLDGLVQPTA